MPIITRRTLLTAAAVSASTRLAGAQPAEPGAGWTPRHPIQIVVGFAPGGGSDIVARGIAEAARELSPVPVVVVNKPGAAGILAAQQVARATPDGTQLVVSGGSETVSMPFHREVPYKPLEDFQHLLLIARYPLFLCVRADGPYRTLDDLMTRAKAEPGQVSHGSSGVGSMYHSAFLVVNQRAGTEMLHVPYTGGGPTLTALAAGDIDVAYASPDEFKGLFEGGVLRLLAVASRERVPGFETVPTLIESGLDVFIENMKGLSAPAATPEPIASWLRDTFRRALQTPAWESFARQANMVTAYQDKDEYTRTLRDMAGTIAAALRSG